MNLKSKNTWNLNELRESCKSLGRTIPEILFQTIKWKLFQINYHGVGAKDLISKYLTSGFNSNDPKFIEEWNKATAQLVAFAHAFDTIADILLQIINYAYFDKPIKKGSVKAKTILKDLKIKYPKAAILITGHNFFHDQNISYIRAFINTEKHQHLVDTEFRFEADSKTGKWRGGFRIKSFNDDKQTFDEKWLDDIIDKYPEILFNATLEVGNSINTDLQNEINEKR